MSDVVICALYKFARLARYRDLQAPLQQLMEQQQIRGTLLLASEGINGTVAGARAAIDLLLGWLNAQPELTPVSYKESFNANQPFHRSKVKLKKEIVTLGVEGIDPNRVVGTYVKPKDWNKLISEPDVLLVDTRNRYEVKIGTFKHAIDPQTDSFRQFPEYVRQNLDPERHRRVAMFCTGGIRCEKSTAYLKELGFDEVYHLEGGILQYLADVPETDSLWQGECFVFDGRVAVNHQLEKGQYEQCHACRLPLDPAARQSPLYVEGVSCPHCADQTDNKQRFIEREKQMRLAQQRGDNHLGSQATEAMAKNREHKRQRRQQQKG